MTHDYAIAVLGGWLDDVVLPHRPRAGRVKEIERAIAALRSQAMPPVEEGMTQADREDDAAWAILNKRYGRTVADHSRAGRTILWRDAIDDVRVAIEVLEGDSCSGPQTENETV